MSDAIDGYAADAADLAFLAEIESGCLPAASFDHRAHLRLAYLLLRERGLEDAGVAMKARLLGFLAHHGVDAGKYHATVTGAWLRAVHAAMRSGGGAASSRAFIEANPALLDGALLSRHYSNERLRGDAGRAAFLPPDREPFDGD